MSPVRPISQVRRWSWRRGACIFTLHHQWEGHSSRTLDARICRRCGAMDVYYAD